MFSAESARRFPQTMQNRIPMSRPFPSILGLAIIVAALGGCVNTIDTRGYLADEEVIGDLIPGVDNRDSVLAALGSASITGTFDINTWYYFSRTTSTVAFLRPKIRQQSILKITFNNDGNVDEIHSYTLADAREVNLVSRETPTRGRELGLLEQLFGNIGRFTNQRRTPGAGP